MAATVVDSLIFRDVFSTEEMRGIFSDASRVQWYLDIEAALARVQARLDIIPQTAADEIVAHCHVEQLDLSTLKTQTELIGYPVLPVVHQIVALCSNQAGQYCHWGATTQDITDTATVLQIRAALVLIEEDLAAISAHLAEYARRYRDTLMAGRSNLTRQTTWVCQAKWSIGSWRNEQRTRMRNHRWLAWRVCWNEATLSHVL
jgi:3-carboxy-cis,cis-muconate cycloisomerase